MEVGEFRLDKHDPQYKTCADNLLRQIASAGWRVYEIRFILALVNANLEQEINGLTLQSFPDS